MVRSAVLLVAVGCLFVGSQPAMAEPVPLTEGSNGSTTSVWPRAMHS